MSIVFARFFFINYAMVLLNHQKIAYISALISLVNVTSFIRNTSPTELLTY